MRDDVGWTSAIVFHQGREFGNCPAKSIVRESCFCSLFSGKNISAEALVTQLAIQIRQFIRSPFVPEDRTAIDPCLQGRRAFRRHFRLCGILRGDKSAVPE